MRGIAARYWIGKRNAILKKHTGNPVPVKKNKNLFDTEIFLTIVGKPKRVSDMTRTKKQSRVLKSRKSLRANQAIHRAKRMLATQERQGVFGTTIDHIARESGLSSATVLRVLEGKLDVDKNFKMCPRCHAMVLMPCVKCRVDDYFRGK
jgi:hypothetical protein